VIAADLATEAAILARFQRERFMLAQLAHPNVVAACDAREPGGLLYFVMEFVDGMSFATLVKQLSRSGDVRQARLLFERMLGYANHLGLFAEELGPSGEHLGKFPQAFTHVALISEAFDLNRRLSAADENDALEA
jgi:pentatricopeptide repeat protein